MINKLTIQNVAYLVIIIIGVGWLAYIGAGILLPLIFAILFAVFLTPVTKWFNKKIKVRWLCILLSFLSVLLPIALVAMLFVAQLGSMMDELPSITQKLNEGVVKISDTIKRIVPIRNFNPSQFLKDNIGTISDGSVSALGKGIVSTSGILLSIALSFLYTFFLLLYRDSIKKFIIHQFARYKRDDIADTLLEIKATVQSYIGGVGIVILILTTVNSLGLFIIGVKYPIFWGALAGILSIIPYIGTFLGGLFPFLYTLATADQNWQPIAIVVFYIVVQQLEGNFITPKVVGDKVNINPFVAIISIIFFSSFWGIGGIILALPIVSVVRIILDQFDETRAIALLMSSDISKSSKFEKIHQGSNAVHILTKEEIMNNPEDLT